MTAVSPNGRRPVALAGGSDLHGPRVDMLRCRLSHQVSGTGHLCANEHRRSHLPGQGARGQRLLRL